MNQDGSINYEQLHDLIDWHIENGTDGIVAVGTTGESATLPVEEHLAVIEATVKHVNKRVPVIAGTGANNTVEAIALSKAAEQAGADYTLSVVPTTTNLRKKAFTNISKPSPKPLRFRWLSIMFPAVPSSA